jgi:hypothetical protein
MNSTDCHAGMSVLYKNEEGNLVMGKVLYLDPTNKQLAWIKDNQGQNCQTTLEDMQKTAVFNFPEKQPLPEDLFEGQKVFYENNSGYAPAIFKRMHDTDEGLCWVELHGGNEDLAEIATLLRDDTPQNHNNKKLKM